MNTNSELALSPLERTGELLFRARDYTPIPIGAVAILFAEPSVWSLVGGFAVSLMGEAVRTYGVAFIGSISRTRSYSNGQLVRTGPFSVLRNPLYFGNLLLSAGLALMSGVWWIPALVVAFFYAQYIPIVAWEERKLTRIFGEDYARYCREVPNRWFPRLSAFWQFDWCLKPDSWRPALRSEKRTLTAVLIVVAVMFCLFWWGSAQTESPLPLANFLSFGK